MDIRVLEYFLAIAREQNISAAAEALHITQPTLSRQMKELETSLGRQLFLRGNRKITLTEEGMILRKRADEILSLVKRTEEEIVAADDISEGDVYIGAGETDAVRLLTKAMSSLQENYPNIRFHIASGDTNDVIEHLDKGLYDFGLVFHMVDTTKYEYLEVPQKDHYGILMRKDSPLAQKAFIEPQDLWDKSLICNRKITDGDTLTTWLHRPVSEIHIAGTYNLLYNASLMVSEGIGYAFALDKIINVTGDTNLCYRPLKPDLEATMYLMWKKYQVLSKAAEKFLDEVTKTCLLYTSNRHMNCHVIQRKV